MMKIHWAAEVRTSHLQLTRNEHNPVAFIEKRKASPAADWLFVYALTKWTGLGLPSKKYHVLCFRLYNFKVGKSNQNFVQLSAPSW